MMGFFNRIRDGVSNIFNDIKNFLSDIFGNTESTASDTAEKRVDVQKELVRFKEPLSKEASKEEQHHIERAMKSFDGFIKGIKSGYPLVVEIAEKKKREAEQSLRGTYMNYVEKHITTNNEDLQAVLLMQPGEAKRNASQKFQDGILAEAEKVFKKSIQSMMESLNEDLSKRLENELQTRKRALEEQISYCEKLRTEMKTGNVNFSKLENESIPIIEAAQCTRCVGITPYSAEDRIKVITVKKQHVPAVSPTRPVRPVRPHRRAKGRQARRGQ